MSIDKIMANCDCQTPDDCRKAGQCWADLLAAPQSMQILQVPKEGTEAEASIVRSIAAAVQAGKDSGAKTLKLDMTTVMQRHGGGWKMEVTY